MPLQKFAPVSPDPSIQTDGDMTLAKFGHLNSVIDYINTYVAADSLQLAGTGPLTSVARYITDSLGNTSTLAISTVNIGVGTDIPTSLLDVVRYTTGSVNNAYQFRILNSADGQYPYSVLLLEHNNRTGVGNQGGAAIIIKDGFANVTRGELGFDYFNSGSYSSAGGNLRLSNSGQGNLLLSTAGVDALRIFKDQGVQIGGVSTNLSSIARLHIKGSGSTSATTSLLVQNSSATEIFKVRDDGAVKIGGGSFGHPNNTIFQINDTAGNERLRLDASTMYVVQNIDSLGVGGLTISGNPFLTLKPTNGNNGYVSIGGNQTNSVAYTNETRDFVYFNQNWNAVVGSSDLTMNALRLNNNINFTNSTGTNIARGLYIVPTLTAVSDYRAIESDVGGAYFNTTSVQASAVLQADSTTQGFLPPRMTTAQKLAIATPAAGLMVYDTDLNKSFTYDGTTWQAHW